MKLEVVKYMLMAQDMDRAVAFYRDVIGLEAQHTSPYWSELSAGGAVVALHGGGDGSENRTGLSFQVSEIEGACREVAAGGGEILKGPEAREGEPIKLADARDTEGNIFMLTEFLG